MVDYIDRPDDPLTVALHEGRFYGGKALIVLGGPSGIEWQAAVKKIQPDVLLSANGKTDLPNVEYWMLAENMNYQWTNARKGDRRGKQFAKIVNAPNTAKFRLISHRTWNLVTHKENCIRIRRAGYELSEIPESFSFRHYGDGYLNGWMFKHTQACQGNVQFRVGTVGLHLIHHAGILGCREVHTIGYDLMFKGVKHHWYSYPSYQADRFTTDAMFVKRQYGDTTVHTRWAWIETAQYLRSIQYLFDRDELEWVDHSNGLLRYEGLWCAQ